MWCTVCPVEAHGIGRKAPRQMWRRRRKSENVGESGVQVALSFSQHSMTLDLKANKTLVGPRRCGWWEDGVIVLVFRAYTQKCPLALANARKVVSGAGTEDGPAASETLTMTRIGIEAGACIKVLQYVHHPLSVDVACSLGKDRI